MNKIHLLLSDFGFISLSNASIPQLLFLLFDCNEEERACCFGILFKTSFKLSNNFLFNDHLCNIHGLIDLKYICSCICWEACVDPEIFFPQGGPRDICLAMGEGVQGLFLVILL